MEKLRGEAKKREENKIDREMSKDWRDLRGRKKGRKHEGSIPSPLCRTWYGLQQGLQ